jgi:hypothetical protein
LNYIITSGEGKDGLESRILKSGELRYNNIIRDNIPEDLND